MAFWYGGIAFLASGDCNEVWGCFGRMVNQEHLGEPMDVGYGGALALVGLRICGFRCWYWGLHPILDQ
jgi:hypothetical protein